MFRAAEARSGGTGMVTADKYVEERRRGKTAFLDAFS
jgi:hypothetical protein